MADQETIKLFGRTILLPDSHDAADDVAIGSDLETIMIQTCHALKDVSVEMINEESKDLPPIDSEEMTLNKSDATSSLNDEQGSHELAAKAGEDPRSEEDHADAGGSGQLKGLKKPDKIIPCPRCNSMDTKFCYYNNYNVNQPRHFCRSCQRYWTAGGSMRNVPVGAGKRKSKHSSSNYHHLIVSTDRIPSIPAADQAHGPVAPCRSPGIAAPPQGNAAALNCGLEASLSQNKVTTLSLGEKKEKNERRPVNRGENDERSCTTIKASSNVQNDISGKVVQVGHNHMLAPCTGLMPMHPLQYCTSYPWGFPWNPTWNDVTATAVAGRCSSELINGQRNCNPCPIPLSSPPMMAAPICIPAIPVPFIPPSFVGCSPNWPDGSWVTPWLGIGSHGSLSASSIASGGGHSGSNTMTLGKHRRDLTSDVEDKPEKSLWIPKTLRIDDPDEAAKSSIWDTLGIKPGKDETTIKGGCFSFFQPKSHRIIEQSDATIALQANPAGFSRSQKFQESI